MYHTLRNYIRKPAADAYLRTLSADAEHMYNTANFYVRNTMTGLRKDPSCRTPNEAFVLGNVRRGIDDANKNAGKRFRAFIGKAGEAVPSSAFLAEKYIKRALGVRFFTQPDKEKWLLDYGTLDAIFKGTDDPVYRRMPSQVNQNCIRRLCASWKGYFSAIKEYAAHPDKFSGRPQIPGYRHRGHAAVWMTNQVCPAVYRKGKLYLILPVKGRKRLPEDPEGCALSVCLGKAVPAGWKFVKAEAKALSGKMALLSTFDDSAPLPVVPEHPDRIMGIDLGLNNTMAAAGNFGSEPFVIKGAWLKSVNQWYNKETARLRSAQVNNPRLKSRACQMAGSVD